LKNKKVYVFWDTVYLQVTELRSPNLHCRCIWHGYTNWQIHPRFDLLFEVTRVKMLTSNFRLTISRVAQIVTNAHRDL